MAQYPRELKLDASTSERLISYLNTELVNHGMEREPFLSDLKLMQRDYYAPDSKEPAKFPFTGASRIIIPLVAIAVEAIHARFMTTLFGGSQVVNAKFRDLKGIDIEAAQGPYNSFSHYVLEHVAKIRNPVSDILLELEKFGTGIGKCGYVKEIAKAVRYNEATGEDETFYITKKDGAEINNVSNSRFLMPFIDQDTQKAAWVGEIHEENTFTVKRWCEQDFFKPATWDKIKDWVWQSSNTSPMSEQTNRDFEESLENRKAIWPKTIKWAELWMSFDIDGDDIDEEIVVHYHQESQTIMSVRYNWYDDLHRCYRYGNYMPVEGRWRGIGICKQAAAFQRIITTIHRQRLDNATMANMKMFIIHKLSGYGPKEPIFPGKMWFVDDMTHIAPLQTSDINTSAFANEQSALLYQQQRLGINELNQGLPQVGTPGTATSDVARLKEGKYKFDYSLQNIKNFAGELFLDVMVNTHQFGGKFIKSYLTNIEQSDVLYKVLTLPIENIRNSIIFNLHIVGENENKIIDRQNWVQMAQLLTQYYTSIMQLLPMSGLPPESMMMVSRQAMIAATEAMKQILETFDVNNIDRIVMEKLMQQFTATQGLMPNGNQPTPEQLLGAGGSNGSNGNGEVPQGMDFLNKIVSSLSAGGSPNLSRV